MKMSKKTWIIIAIVGVIVLIYWLMTKNKKVNKESSYLERKGALFQQLGCPSGQVCCNCSYGLFSGYDCNSANSCSDADSCCTQSGGKLIFAAKKGKQA